MSDQLKSIVFTAVIALVCSLLLTGAASGLKARKLRNVAVDRQKNILKSVGLVKADQKPSAATIEALYHANIRCYAMAGTGQILAAHADTAGLPVCFYVKQDKPEAYILPVDSRGLWGKIHGYMALENDGKTVAGFSVYSHNETPGLGGEIEKPWFQKNFVGKKIVDERGNFVSVGIAKGKVAEVIAKDRQNNYVDGISGASLTGKFLTGGLKEVLQEYEPLSKEFRAGAVSLPAGS
ncbi:FMN-binding protein [Desulfosarcina ovata]|uniref:Na(+)-translocating NADH-quinone reductase subunit C n=1 Tax=Desulfosarcina ovata subsp. ovata TaxID=2752305 RepID=A0A5K8ACA8_9BACT|nr:FMN-binding protein [Desulfosarcina ovata]BBO90255.1 Na(+)-translocating NADH-quinone reductase subunit C [Desulfosarcina ovata subsp. ovata]